MIGRFVQEDEESVGVVEQFAIDPDRAGVGFNCGIAGRHTIDGDFAGFQKSFGFATAAVAEGSKELVKATWNGHGHDLWQADRWRQKIWIP